MPLFELDGGRLVPAQFGRTVPQGLNEEILESVRSQVLEIIARPLFPITWRDLSRQSSAVDTIPRLTALDATGQVVSVEVMAHLTSAALISALSHLADTAALSWTDLASEYPGGLSAFRSSWVLFRDSMPSSPGAGPRLVLVVGAIDDSARAALEVLAPSGVEVHELSYRQMSNGRVFVDVNPVGARVYAHVPQLVSTAAEVAHIEQDVPAHASSVASTPMVTSDVDIPLDEEPQRVRTEPVYPRVRRHEKAESDSHKGAPLAPLHAPAENTQADTTGESRTAYTPRVTGLSAAPEPQAKSLERNFAALQAIAVIVGNDISLHVREEFSLDLPIVLMSTGHIRVGEHQFVDPDQAIAAFGVAPVDAWEELRLGDMQGPSLADALREINVEIARQYTAKH